MSDQQIKKEDIKPFVVLFHKPSTSQISVQGVLSPDPTLAISIVSQDLVDKGEGENVVVGVFDQEDYDRLGDLFKQLNDARDNLDLE